MPLCEDPLNELGIKRAQNLSIFKYSFNILGVIASQLSNIFIKVTGTRVFVVYPMWVYQNRYDRIAVQFCLRVNRLNPCYA